MARAARKAPAEAGDAASGKAGARPNDADNWDARLGFLMHDVSRLRRSVFDEFMKPMGLTRSQWWILAHLSRHDGMIQSDLAGVLDVGKAALGELLGRLETSGLVVRRADEMDGRVRRVYLTSKGSRTVQTMRAKNHELSERILEGLSMADRHALAAHLAVVKANLLSIRDEGEAR